MVRLCLLPILDALLAGLAGMPSRASAADCYGGQPQCGCSNCQRHCRHCCQCWCEPPPQGMVVSSLPAFPVAAFPSNFAGPATYSLNVTAAPQPSIEDLQRALDAAKAARAPVNCCGP